MVNDSSYFDSTHYLYWIMKLGKQNEMPFDFYYDLYSEQIIPKLIREKQDILYQLPTQSQLAAGDIGVIPKYVSKRGIHQSTAAITHTMFELYNEMSAMANTVLNQETGFSTAFTSLSILIPYRKTIQRELTDILEEHFS